MPDEITTGELSRRLERLERWTQNFEDKHDRQYASLQISLSTLSFIHKDVYEADMRGLRDDLKSTRAIAMWALGCIAAVVIGAVLASVIGLGGVFK